MHAIIEMHPVYPMARSLGASSYASQIAFCTSAFFSKAIPYVELYRWEEGEGVVLPASSVAKFSINAIESVLIYRQRTNLSLNDC